MNILTFDVEEWFHLLDCDATASVAQWDRFESRLDANVDRILQILDETGSQATFFVLGWIARRYPAAIRRIAEKYQIGCHTILRKNTRSAAIPWSTAWYGRAPGRISGRMWIQV